MGMSAALIEERVGQGWHLCSMCHALSRPERTKCFHCGRPVGGPVSSTPARTLANKATPGAPRKTARPAGPSNEQATRGRTSYGSLTEPVDIIIRGLPESQGSGKAVAAGVYLHVNAAALKQWRARVALAAKETLGAQWVAPNAPLTIIVVLTVPPPAGAREGDHADGYRDIDKLLRAINDGLSPTRGFRAIASDMRHVTTLATKTYPTSHSTHPLALPEPGAWVRIQPAEHPTIEDGQWVFRVPLPDHARIGARTTVKENP